VGSSRFARAVRRRPWPIHPVALAAYPVLFVYGENVGELRLDDLVLPLTAVLAVTVAVLLGAALIAGDVRRAALPVSALAVGLLAYGHVAAIVQPLGLPGIVQQAGWLGLVAIATIVAARVSVEPLARLTFGLNLGTALLVGLTIASILPSEMGRLGRITVGDVAPVVSQEAPGRNAGRDIYYLVFDRYGSRTSLERLYGWDDGPFLDTLRARGFVVAPDSHANYLKTTLSLAGTLNLDYLDDLVEAEGIDSDDYGPVFERLSDHAVGRFLRERGYEYVHVGSWYSPTRTSEIADVNLLDDGPSDFVAALEAGSALPALRRRLGLSRSVPHRERQYDTNRAQLDVLDDLADEPGTRFVFAHILLPHPPHVFAADGSFVPDDEGRSRPQQHNEQMAYLHTRMDALLDRLLALPEDEQPIIILQGDEGPFPVPYGRNTATYDWSTASEEDLEIKFGILNAWYVPGAPIALPPAVSSVNTFRILFDSMFGSSLGMLPDRSYTSAAKVRPYDLTEITDRLPSLRADR
jgi:hypothetical protein